MERTMQLKNIWRQFDTLPMSKNQKDYRFIEGLQLLPYPKP